MSSFILIQLLKRRKCLFCHMENFLKDFNEISFYLIQWFPTEVPRHSWVPWKNSSGASNAWNWLLFIRKMLLGVPLNCPWHKQWCCEPKKVGKHWCNPNTEIRLYFIGMNKNSFLWWIKTILQLLRKCEGGRKPK